MLKRKSESELRTRKSMPITIHEDDALDITKSKMRRCVSMPTTMFDVKSILKFRTVDESLHSSYGSEGGSSRGSITFSQVQIREYARTVGDNPSCSSGPPVSIAWQYNQMGAMGVEQYETNRPPRRSHFEMVLPRKVRQDMLRREWDVSQKQIAEAVRRNVKVKNQRKATVNNLGKATNVEVFVESAGRKFRRLLTFQKRVSRQVKDLEDKFNEASRRRSQLRLERSMASEYSEITQDPAESTQEDHGNDDTVAENQ